MSGLETFKEISMGGLSKDHLVSQLVETRIQFNAYAKILFEHERFSPIPKAEKVQFKKFNWLK